MKIPLRQNFPYIILDFKRNENELKFCRDSGARAETESPLKGSLWFPSEVLSSCSLVIQSPLGLLSPSLSDRVLFRSR